MLYRFRFHVSVGIYTKQERVIFLDSNLGEPSALALINHDHDFPSVIRRFITLYPANLHFYIYIGI